MQAAVIGAAITMREPKMFGLPVSENTLVRTPTSVCVTQCAGISTPTAN